MLVCDKLLDVETSVLFFLPVDGHFPGDSVGDGVVGLHYFGFHHNIELIILSHFDCDSL